LGEKGVGGFACESREVRIVDNQRSKISNGAHDAADHEPAKCGALGSAWLVHYGADAFGPYDSPDEEGDAGGRDEEGFDGEEMADLVNRRIDEGEGAKPEEDEGDEVNGRGA
jgi:hypothetical protein